jgi:hypothetical protein
MKFLAIVMFVLLPLKGCEQSGSQGPVPSSVSYTALSRGSYWKITADPDSLSVNKDREGDTQSVPMKPAHWKKILSLTNKIDLASIADIDPPSNKRAFDGAAMATLEITADKKFASPTFDHGNPPERLRELVTYLLTLSESIE